MHLPPPVLFVGGYAVGWLLDRWHPLRLRFDDPLATRLLATLLGGIAVGLGGWALLTFVRRRTTFLPHRAASHLVVEGPYRFTRNPMYVALTSAYLAALVATGMVWALLVLPLVLALLTRLVVTHEERHLAESFGPDYAQYRGRVRRWL